MMAAVLALTGALLLALAIAPLLRTHHPLLSPRAAASARLAGLGLIAAAASLEGALGREVFAPWPVAVALLAFLRLAPPRRPPPDSKPGPAAAADPGPPEGPATH